MTLPTFKEATDEMLGLFKTAWAGSTALNGAVAVPVQWPGVDTDPPDPQQPFARIRIRYMNGKQSSFGKLDARRFTRFGLVMIQVFAPVSRGGGETFGQNLAIIARDAYEGVGTPSGIWFRNVNMSPMGVSDAWHQFNVSAEFQYDELK